ncbi:Imm7 family immunity protein [Streptomyces sp. NBC_00564]|uniref:Imm7 family immunity protein n=1 Tax=unclassified Streptomyces TaxID=2593676 RepID=UPI002FCDBAEB|nr:immunity 7 family protein [Streptomyces sp. NBC_00564]
MFEYHGWITVRDTAVDDDDEVRLRQVVDELRLRIAQMDSPYLLDLRWMNGEPFIHLGGHSNHRSSPDVVGLFEHVAAVAPGSYGLLHIRDDEDPGHENEVQVLRLARGTITRHSDALLSPCIPTLEDPFTG